ncbi:MAG TPA: hypothetical protein ENN81_03700 [Phycisphaerales bacterium]|nr:hypothetical protein [Phycisphaerales bacterium]
MKIIAHCPKCRTARHLDASAADRRVRCPNCRRLFKVPSLEELHRALAVLEQTRGATVYVDERGRAYA